MTALSKINLRRDIDSLDDKIDAGKLLVQCLEKIEVPDVHSSLVQKMVEATIVSLIAETNVNLLDLLDLSIKHKQELFNIIQEECDFLDSFEISEA